MDDESSINMYVYAFFGILAAIGYLIRKQLAKKTVKELKDYAESHNYIFQKDADVKVKNTLSLPKAYANMNIHNYMEIPEKDWTCFWGDCDGYVTTKDASMHTCSSFYIFLFNNIIIPEFELRDNQGLTDSFFNLFNGKKIQLDNDFSASYLLSGTFETQVKKFFTARVKKAFLSMDNKHLASERNLNLADFANLITRHAGKSAGLSFFGSKKKLYIFSSEKRTLDARNTFYKLACEIAKAIVQDANKNSPLTSNQAQTPKDDISNFLAAEETKINKTAPTPVPSSINNKPINGQENEESFLPPRKPIEKNEEENLFPPRKPVEKEEENLLPPRKPIANEEENLFPPKKPVENEESLIPPLPTENSKESINTEKNNTSLPNINDIKPQNSNESLIKTQDKPIDSAKPVVKNNIPIQTPEPKDKIVKTNNIKIDAKNNPCDQLLWLSAMMVIDKNIHVNELRFIIEYGIKLGLDKTKIEQIVNIAKDQPDNLSRLLEKSDLPKSEEFMRMLIRVVYADGKIAKEEISFLKLAAKKMKYEENELKILLEEEMKAFKK